jgi:hypothetical protein
MNRSLYVRGTVVEDGHVPGNNGVGYPLAPCRSLCMWRAMNAA